MKRGYSLYGQGQHFLEKSLDRRAVFAANIEIVAACFAGPVVVLLACVPALRKGTELTESIRAEKDTLLGAETDYDLWPVDHGRAEELQASAAKRQDVSFLND